MAKRHATMPPQSCPTITAFDSPVSRMTAATSETSIGMAYGSNPFGLSLRL